MTSPVEGPPSMVPWWVDAWSGEDDGDFAAHWVGKKDWDVVVEVEEDDTSVILRLYRLVPPLAARAPEPAERTRPRKPRRVMNTRGEPGRTPVALARAIGDREVVDGYKNRTVERYLDPAEIGKPSARERSEPTSNVDRPVSAPAGSLKRAEAIQRRCLEYLETHTSEYGGDEIRQEPDGSWTYRVAFTGSLRRHRRHLPDEVQLFEGRHSLDELDAATRDLWPFLLEHRIVPVGRSVIAGRHLVVTCRGKAWPDEGVLKAVRTRYGGLVKLTTAD